MKIFGRMLMLSAVLAVVSACWLGCGGDNGAGPSKGTAPRITTSTLPSGAVGTSYSQTLKASGDTPITWSLESGALPTGLSLLKSGTISGTPTTAGTYNFSVDASNSAGSDVASFSITITGGSTTPTTYSLDGIWGTSYGTRIIVSGSTGVFGAFGNVSALWQSAIDKNIIKLNDQYWRNISSTGNLTWSVQELMVQNNTSTPTVANGTGWETRTFTMSADGQTLTVKNGNGTVTNTWTRASTYSLDGVWESGVWQVTVSGNKGVISGLPLASNTSGNTADAINKGYIKVGTEYWRNLTSTGNLTWSGQAADIEYYTSNPGVAIGLVWGNSTFTMSANGQTLTVAGSGGGSWGRKQ